MLLMNYSDYYLELLQQLVPENGTIFHKMYNIW
jgi:hypothetical protein